MEGIRYHAIGNEVFLKGIRRVACYGESDDPDQNKAESEELAKEVTKHLNEWFEILDFFDEENIKVRRAAKNE
jgi:hypothetical protein